MSSAAKDRSTLDEAWTSWVDGRAEDALRAATAVLETDPMQLGAAALLAHALVSQGRNTVAGRAAVRLVDAFVRRGDLPRALAAAERARRAGLDPKPLFSQIATAFGEGSPRLADVAPAPPPLPPKNVRVDRSTPGAALVGRAERALESFLNHREQLPENTKVPVLPLFSALRPPALEALLGAWELRELSAGETAIREGTEGRDAFVVVRGSLRAERHRETTVVLAVFGPGALFGEMALVSDAPRAASVVAEEAALLLAASRDRLESLASEHPAIGRQLSEFCRARMVSNLVRHSEMLRAVDPADRPALMARFETRSFEQGERLVERGRDNDRLFLIASGGVRVVGRDADGGELEIALLGPGDVVGEISLVLRQPATADVIATHQTIALSLQREQFRAAIKQHPKLLGELYDLATKRVEELRSVVAQQAVDVEEMVLL